MACGRFRAGSTLLNRTAPRKFIPPRRKVKKILQTFRTLASLRLCGSRGFSDLFPNFKDSWLGLSAGSFLRSRHLSAKMLPGPRRFFQELGEAVFLEPGKLVQLLAAEFDEGLDLACGDPRKVWACGIETFGIRARLERRERLLMDIVRAR